MPAKRFGSQIDLQKAPVLGLVPESSPTASAPANPVNGQFWFDTTVGRLMVREANAWVFATRTGAELAANKGVANGYASLDATTKVPIAQVPTGTTGSTVALGNDGRFTDSRTPNGPAGGLLAGSYPNPTLAPNAITDNAGFSAAMKDGSAATATLRSLGTGAAQAMAGNTRLDTIAAPTGPVSLNSQRLVSLATPTADTDAATKVYVDLARQGIRQKDAVRVATTGPITLTGTQTIDTVALNVGDRVLVKDGTAAQMGLWVVAAGAWTRATDADTAAELADGTTTFVQEGGANANFSYAQINTLTTLGTDPQTWVQQGAATNYNAGAGLTQTGQTFDVVGTANRILANADNIDISPNYAGQTSIVTVGTLTNGSLGAGFTPVALAQGGTGATTAVGARTALGAVGKVSANLGALVAGSESTITHNLGTLDVQAQFRAADGYEELLSWRVIDVNTIGVTADVPYSAAALRVVIIG